MHLRPADFQRHPVWINCHAADESEPWYDDCGEDDYRPHEGPVPEPPYAELFALKATATLPDGRQLPGFLNVGPALPNLETTDAVIFGEDGRQISLMPATMGLADSIREQNLHSLGREESLIFPTHVVVVPELGPEAPEVVVHDWFSQTVSWRNGRL